MVKNRVSSPRHWRSFVAKDMTFWHFVFCIYMVTFVIIIALFIRTSTIKVDVPDRFVHLSELDVQYSTDAFVCKQVTSPVYVVDCKTNAILCYEAGDYDDDNSLTMYSVYDANGEKVIYSGDVPNNIKEE